MGRLYRVYRNTVLTSEYTYDANGNRLTAPGLSGLPTYDNQDRLLEYDGVTYEYTANGELLSTTTASNARTEYTYDALGNLRFVELPSSHVIEYLVDGLNRRVGKRVDGVLEYGLLYDGQLRPVAKVDGNGTMVARYVYGSRTNVPEYMQAAGVTYRILTDHVGSVRLVIRVADGAIAQRIDYDEFGRVTDDTEPGFQPFGFAGGLYDPDTGLTRLGARDYDASVGRWTAKDSIRFESGDTNFYGYVLSNPVNFIDPDGRELGATTAGAGMCLVGAEGGAAAVLSGAGAALGGLACGLYDPCRCGAGYIAYRGACGLFIIDPVAKQKCRERAQQFKKRCLGDEDEPPPPPPGNAKPEDKPGDASEPPFKKAA